MTIQPNAEVVYVESLEPGDEVTEHDTPEGPWYRVVSVSSAELVLDARLHEDDDELIVAIGYKSGAVLLRRCPP